MSTVLFLKKIYYSIFGSNLRKFIKGGGTIGTGCSIPESTYFGSEPWLITIGNNVRITDGVRFYTHDGAVWVLRNLYKELEDVDVFGRIVIGDNVHIGANSMILPGVNIGNNVIIGVGTIVTRNIPDNSVVVGVPGRVIKTIDEYYNDNKDCFFHTKKLKNKKEYVLSRL